MADPWRAHALPFGAELTGEGVRFRLWAPLQQRVLLEIEDRTPEPMQPEAGGWHQLVLSDAGAGTRYRYRLEDGTAVPDPASRFQPDDVHGFSEVIDPRAFRWTDSSWQGRPWSDAVIYELHVGTFTPEGTFRAAIDRFDHLLALGVTAIELMPVGDFPGGRNWGYDGVLWYAPDSSYGRPEDLKALIDAAHAHGLMVILDVIYNHLGPDGNYLPLYCPFFTERHHTPWGAAINYDGAEAAPVRAFAIQNALYWLNEYHLDGLRLDAVHAIIDQSPRHLLDELAATVQAAMPPGRQVHLVLENERNEADRLLRDGGGRPRRFSAQWADEVHHGLHVALTGESTAYYAPFHGEPARLARALAEGFAFQGEAEADGVPGRGQPSAHLPTGAFVTCLQNHDQIGNRAMGERIDRLAPPEAVRAASAIHLLAPSVPLLFMGEEWGATEPFLFFCDFGPELSQAVREGRRAEFKAFPAFADPESRERIPDPTDPATFARSRLDWAALDAPQHADRLAWSRRVLALRHARIQPLIPSLQGNHGSWRVLGPAAIEVTWQLADGRRLGLLANLSAEPLAHARADDIETLWHENPGDDPALLGPWEVLWTLAMPSALERLALRQGIEPSYRDTAGQLVPTSDATRVRLLAAMGFDVPDEAAAQRALRQLDEQGGGRLLPPVTVIREGRPLALALRRHVAACRWWIGTEDEAEHEGEARPAAGRLLLQPDRPLPLGYHRIRLLVDGGEHDEALLIIVPARCWQPPELEGGHLWGIATQLYALRALGAWGAGDFGSLGRLVPLAASRGAALVGLNPLHVRFLDRPVQASPYAPASRHFLDPLAIDPTAVPEFQDAPEAQAMVAGAEFQTQVRTLEAGALVDWPAVAELKLAVLAELHAAFEAKATPERRAAFARFRARQGDRLERFALFQALAQSRAGEPWQSWPQDLRRPDSRAVAVFAGEARARIDFFAWLQWTADEQLGRIAADARERGMAIGLYRDLAVGCDGSGFDAWAAQALVIAGAHVGAPPDAFNPTGQDWGLPPLAPEALRDQGYQEFIELLRANMRHAGALRIDHVMALGRLFWIPAGAPAGEGAYVRYPQEDLLGILALESRRQRCLVIGEDLGTVPPGFRERLEDAGVLGYRVLYFEWLPGMLLRPPGAYTEAALATIGSHDLATLRGWWEGRDLVAMTAAGLFPEPGEPERQRQLRAVQRDALLDGLREASVPLPADLAGTDPWSPLIAIAVHRFLGRSASRIAMVQMEDLAGAAEQINLPGTTDAHPNWRRRLPMTLEAMAEDEGVAALLRAMDEERAGLSPRGTPRP